MTVTEVDNNNKLLVARKHIEVHR